MGPSSGTHCWSDMESKGGGGGRVIGSKCAVQNLGQAGRSTSPLLFSPSVVLVYSGADKTWQFISLLYWKFLFFKCFPPVCLSHLSILKPSCLFSLQMSSQLHLCLNSWLYGAFDCTALRVCAASQIFFFFYKSTIALFRSIHNPTHITSPVCLQCNLPLSWVWGSARGGGNSFFMS